MSNFLELVAKERTRQIVGTGYGRSHDDKHTNGELADAAACYAANKFPYFVEKKFIKKFKFAKTIPLWPWNEEYFKKEDHDRKQQLIIAAAFINAEYDRIVRAEQKQNGETNEIPKH